MLTIALQPVPSQLVNVTLAGQPCSIALYQRGTGMYCDLYVSNVLVIGGVVCQNVNRIVRDAYRGFVGDLLFLDTQGGSDPTYDGLGSRFVFAYLEASDLQ